MNWIGVCRAGSKCVEYGVPTTIWGILGFGAPAATMNSVREDHMVSMSRSHDVLSLLPLPLPPAFS